MSFSLQKGFSLIEMLVVIAILVILAVSAVPVFRDFGVSRGLDSAVFEAKALLEYARNEARARQSPVWLAFRQVTNSGALEVQAAAFGAMDGTTNGASTNLVMLSRLVRMKSVGLQRFGELPVEVRGMVRDVPSELLDNANGIVISNSPGRVFADRWTITFTARGEAMLKGSPAATDGFEPLMGFGLAPARGVQVQSSSPQNIGVTIEGSTATSRILRL